MGVVHLDGGLVGQKFEIVVLLAEAAHDVADGAGDQEVLLHQAKLFAGHGRVGRIEHARDVFAGDLLLDGVDVVAAIEDVDVEVFGRARGEQAEPVHGVAEIADDGHVGRHAEHDLVVDPGLLQLAVGIALRIDPAVHGDADGLFRVLDLERGAVGLPAVGLLALEAVDDLLLEEAVFVVDAVAVTGHAQGGERFQEAGSQASQAAVAKAGIGFAVENFLEADAESGEHFAAKFLEAQVRQVVAQRAAHEEFHGQVVEALGVFVAEARLGLEHAIDNAVADGQRNRIEVVNRLQLRGGADESVADMTKDGFAQHFGGPHLSQKCGRLG